MSEATPGLLWLTEADVSRLLDLPDAIDAIRAALRAGGGQASWTLAKTHAVFGEGHTLHALGGGLGSEQLVGVKSWTHTAGGASPVLLLWDSESGWLRAVVEAFALGQLRTASISGVATDALASPDAEVAALLGTGKQALPQLAAVAAVRPLREVRIWSRDPERRATFAERARGLGIAATIVVADSVAAATEGAAVITTATRAREAFLDSGQVEGGCHINAIGAITPERRELTDALVARCAPVVADDPETAVKLSPELDAAASVTSLAEQLAAPPAAPLDERSQPSLFKAMGIGLADVALGAAVLARATEAGLGRTLPDPERVAPRLVRESPAPGRS